MVTQVNDYSSQRPSAIIIISNDFYSFLHIGDRFSSNRNGNKLSIIS